MPFQLLRQLAVLLGLLLFSTETPAQPQATYEWATSGGGPKLDSGLRVGSDAAGNVYMAGQFAETVYFGATKLVSQGDYDIFLAKYDAQGHLLWIRQAGGPDRDQVEDIAVDALGNVVLTGEFDAGYTATTGALATMSFGPITLTGGSRLSELYVAKYDAQGTVQWAQQSVGQSGNSGNDLALDGDGNCYVSGVCNGPARFNQLAVTGGRSAHFLAKYDRLGKLIWLRAGLGDYALGSVYINTFQVAVTSTNEVYLLGQFRSSLTLGSLTLTSSNAAGSYYLAKLDPQGTFLWTRPEVLTVQESCRDLAVAPNGNLVVTCEFSGTTTHATHLFTSQGGPDLLTMSFSPLGDFLWGQQVGSANPGQGTDQMGGVAVDPQGNIYTTLCVNSSYRVVSYSATGSQRWSYASPLYIIDIALLAPDIVALTGQLTGTVSFGSTRLTSMGDADAYLAKLAVTGLPPVVSAELIIPNIITPNGDGLNDTFRLLGLPAGSWHLNVYSRWGTRVYETADYHQDWSAPGLADGQYYYSLQSTGQPLIRGWVEVVH